jgi:hypothetical protein
MAWANNPIVVYHGTDNLSAASIRISGLDPSCFKADTDFGAGFYVTPVLYQAEQWANQKIRKTTVPGILNAEVLEFALSRPMIESLSHITFITDTNDFHDLVDYCRNQNTNHGPLPRSTPYAVVYGPVSLWPQRLAIADCEQILFSDPLSLRDPNGTGLDFQNPSQRITPPNGAKFF